VNNKIFSFLCTIIILLSTNAWSASVDLEPIVVTASRMAQHNYKIAGNVSVITQKQIEASNAQTIPDVLKESLGVNVYDNSTSKSAVIDVRGFGDTATRNVLVLVDGRKINSMDTSGPDLVQVPLGAVERIEIIRGAGSVLYGDNAVGGVVNIITKRGRGNLTGRVGANYGSYDSHGTDLEVSGEKNNISYFLYSKYNDQRGYRDNSDMSAKDFSTRLGYDWQDKISLDLSVGWHDDVQELPGGLSATEIATLGRKGSADDADIAYTKDRYVKLSLDVTPWLANTYLGQLIFDFHYRNRDVYDAFNSFGEFSTKRSIDTSGVTARYVFDHTIFNKEVNFVTGIDYFNNENDILGSGSNVDDLTISKDELGIYGFLQYELADKVFVNGGTRYHQAEYAFSQRNVAVDQKQRPDEWVSMGGMRYEYAKGSNLHLNVQQTFRFLATDEWYSTANFPGFGLVPGLNLNLKQQTGTQYEVGLKHDFDKAVIVSVTPYWIDISNEIFVDPVTLGNNNYDKTRRVGVEIQNTVDLLRFFDVDFLDKLEFLAGYTYQDPRFVKGISDGKDIPMVPRHQANFSLKAGLFDHFLVSLMGRYTGSRFAINDTLNETSPAKPYYVLDAKLSYENDPLEIYAAVNNITNEMYSSYVAKSLFSSTKDYFPEPGTNFTAGVNLKF